MKEQMLPANQLTAKHLDQLEQEGELMVDHPTETEREETVIDRLFILNELYLHGWHHTKLKYDSHALNIRPFST